MKKKISASDPLADPLLKEKLFLRSALVDKFGQKIPKSIMDDLADIQLNQDPKLRPDPLIERFLEKIYKRYYNCWYYFFGLPRIVLPMLLTASQRLFNQYNITGCMDNKGNSLNISQCIECNGNNIEFTGDTAFKSLDFVVIVIFIIFLMVLVKRAIAEAHLCVKLLKYHIFVRTSWYYFHRILLLILVFILCAGLSFISSVYLSNKNQQTSFIMCQSGIYQGEDVQLILTDYFSNIYLWTSYYFVSLLFYWPMLGYLIDLYSAPIKNFIEPEDMFEYNGEHKGEIRLFERIALTTRTVKYDVLIHELNKIAKELSVFRYFRLDKIPDEIIQVALHRLFIKGKIISFNRKN